MNPWSPMATVRPGSIDMSLQGGFSLLEVMVAGVVASLGLSGLAALLIASVSGTTQAEHHTVAQLLASELAELMLISEADAAVWLADPPVAATECGLASACTPAQFAQRNYLDWRLRTALDLPQGGGLACLDSSPNDGDAALPGCDGAGGVVVKLFWTGPDGPQRLVLELGI